MLIFTMLCLVCAISANFFTSQSFICFHSLSFSVYMNVRTFMTHAAATSTVSCLIQNGGCSQLCIADSVGWKQSCACNAGYSPATDGLSCIGKFGTAMLSACIQCPV